jgi:hypothetical protein
VDVVTVPDLPCKHAPNALILPDHGENGIVCEILAGQQAPLLESCANQLFLAFQKQPRFRGKQGDDLIRRKSD